MTVEQIGDRDSQPGPVPGAEEQPQYMSYMVADCGHVYTTVTLYDVVDGDHRFVARGQALTTARSPWSDLLRGLQEAVSQLSETTGRMLLDKQGTLIRPERSAGVGVDHFGVAVSAAEPLRALLVGLQDDVSLASARQSLQTVYSQVLDHFSLSDTRSQQAQVKAILTHQPDLVLIAGGTDGGADLRLMNLVDTVALGLNMLDALKRPVVVYAGNKRLRPKVSSALGGLTSLHVAENVRPRLEVEQLDSTINLLAELYETKKMGFVPGLDEVLGWSSLPVKSTAQAFADILDYFAALYRGRVMGVDVGSGSVTMVSAEPDRTRLFVKSDLGMGQPIANLLDEVQADSILDWVISDVSLEGLRSYLLNKSVQPQCLPLTVEEHQLEQAVIRQIIRCALNEATQSWGQARLDNLPPLSLLVLRGSALVNVPRAGQAVLMALDSLQPTGVFPVVADRQGVLPAMGLLAPHDPRMVVQVFEGGALDDLGWVVAPVGRAKLGQTVLNVQMTSSNAGTLQVEVACGTIEVLPLAQGQTAELTLKPARRFDIGAGPGQGRQLTIHGGEMGLIIDARGRPLRLADERTARREQLRQWLWDAGG